MPYGRRIVWDFRAGKEIVSWRPEFQSWEVPLRDGSTKRMHEPYRFAISPDGQYVAEGGNGILHLYKIERPEPGAGQRVQVIKPAISSANRSQMASMSLRAGGGW